MKEFSSILNQRLKDLDGHSGRRFLKLRRGIDFCSNDYLGFSQDDKLLTSFGSQISEISVGSTGSRLLRGHLEVFERVEALLAEFCGRETALIFPSGYQANLGLLSAVLRPGDIVYSDQYNHASLIDGIRLSGAHKEIFPHLDFRSLRRALEKRASGISAQDSLRVIVTESLFGMDGDRAPLVELANLAEEFSALLIVDEAHATGLWGDFESNRGGGLVQSLELCDRVFATVHPAGKAFGVGGAWVCGDAQLRDYLVNFSRPFVFSTAPLPLLPVLLEGVLIRWREEGRFRAQKVFEKTGFFLNLLSKERTKGTKKAMEVLTALPNVTGPIVPIVLGDNAYACTIAESLQAKGFDIRAIRPPTVPEGTSRLRLTLHWDHAESDLKQLVLALVQSLV